MKEKKEPRATRKKENDITLAIGNNYNEIVGLSVILFSIFLFLFLFTNSIGFIGGLFKRVIYGGFGTSGNLMPFLFLFIGINFFLSKSKKSLRSKIFAAFLFLINFSVTSTLKYYDELPKKLSLYLSHAFSNFEERKGSNGGCFGEMLCRFSVAFVGKPGSLAITIFCMFIAILMLSEISIKSLIENSFFSIEPKERDKKFKAPKTFNQKQHVTNEQKVFHLTNENFDDFEENGGISRSREKNSRKNSKRDEADDNAEEDYHLPDTDLLSKSKTNSLKLCKIDIEKKANKLLETLKSFGVEISVIKVARGPTVTRFEIVPGFGVKVSKILGLYDDIALSLAAKNLRIEAPIPGKSAIGIEIPNTKPSPVAIRDCIDTKEFETFKSKVAFALGKDISGQPVIANISEFPHVLIAGATGAGKSVCINALITSILYKANPKEVKFIMVDPKVVELGIYNGIPHLLVPVVTDPKEAAGALNWAVFEMQNRYKLFAKNGVRNITGYNVMMKKNERYELVLPEIVVIIDELADLMMVAKDEVEDAINRLAALARAAGIYLVLATQRPSVNVITGVIKANIPSRISFAVSSRVDSLTILDGNGAEKLVGKGDMLYYPWGYDKPIRVQGNYVSDKEIELVVEYVKSQTSGEPDYSVLNYIQNENEDKDKKNKKFKKYKRNMAECTDY